MRNRAFPFSIEISHLAEHQESVEWWRDAADFVDALRERLRTELLLVRDGDTAFASQMDMLNRNTESLIHDCKQLRLDLAACAGDRSTIGDIHARIQKVSSRFDIQLRKLNDLFAEKHWRDLGISG